MYIECIYNVYIMYISCIYNVYIYIYLLCKHSCGICWGGCGWTTRGQVGDIRYHVQLFTYIVHTNNVLNENAVMFEIS